MSTMEFLPAADDAATGELLLPANDGVDVQGPGEPDPDVTITGPTLDVTATTNYRPDTISDVTAIDFTGSSAATATFLASQFGTGQIATNATITGNAAANTVAVYLSSGQTFDGASLKFADWSSSDKVIESASGDHATITGTSGNDIIEMAGYFDTTDKINGGGGTNELLLNGDYSSNTFITSTMLSNVSQLDLIAGHDYNLIFEAGVVPNGQTMTINASSLGPNDELDLTLEDSGSFVVDLGSGTNIELAFGAQPTTVMCSTGHTNLIFNAVMSAQDKIVGEGQTFLYLNADYSAGYTFGASEFTNISEIFPEGGFSYNLTLNNANVATGQYLYVDGQNAGTNFTFNAASVTNGSLGIFAGPGTNDLTGGAKNDNFTFDSGDPLTASDVVNGGGGTDNTVTLEGNYSTAVHFTNTTITNIQEITLEAGYNYHLLLANGNDPSGHNIQINGDNVGASNNVYLSAASVLNGNVQLLGGAGNDTLIGSGGVSLLQGGGGADKLICESGGTNIVYNFVSDSTSTAHDTIQGFNTAKDTISLDDGLIQPHAINTAVTTGALSDATFDANLAAAIGSAQLHADDAVLFTPNSGTDAGITYLIIDENGTAGYQAGKDIVIEFTAGTNLSGFSMSDFN